MSHQLLCQHLIFERDVFLHPSSLTEGSSDALLDLNFLQESVLQVQHMSLLLSLTAKKATEGYKLLGEAEALHLEVYSLVPIMSDSVAKTLVMCDIPPVLPSMSSGIPSSLKCSKSVDDNMLIPVSKIHHISTEELRILEDFPEVWLEELDPSYVGLESKWYYECCLENCTFTSSGKAAMWSHVAQIHTTQKASCPSCSLESFNLESLQKHIHEAHPSLKLFTKVQGQTK